MQTVEATKPALVSDKYHNPFPDGKVIEPSPKDVVLCTYPDTLDGFLAAWVVRATMSRPQQVPTEFSVGEPEDIIDEGRNWIGIEPVGFKEGGKAFNSSLLISRGSLVGNAPVPFKKWERKFPYGIKTMTTGSLGVIADFSSLAAAAWAFFKADRAGFERRPRLIDYVNDAVSGAFKFNDTKDVVACLETYPRNFGTFDSLVEAADDRKRLPYIVTAGQAVNRYKAQIAHVPHHSVDFGPGESE